MARPERKKVTSNQVKRARKNGTYAAVLGKSNCKVALEQKQSETASPCSRTRATPAAFKPTPPAASAAEKSRLEYSASETPPAQSVQEQATQTPTSESAAEVKLLVAGVRSASLQEDSPLPPEEHALVLEFTTLPSVPKKSNLHGRQGITHVKALLDKSHVIDYLKQNKGDAAKKVILRALYQTHRDEARGRWMGKRLARVPTARFCDWLDLEFGSKELRTALHQAYLRIFGGPPITVELSRLSQKSASARKAKVSKAKMVSFTPVALELPLRIAA